MNVKSSQSIKMKASEANIAEGSTVQLKSGGPIMTVVELYNDDHYAHCKYFSKDDILKDESFSIASLKIASPF